MSLPPVTYQILGWAFVLAAAVTATLVVTLSVRSYRRHEQDFETVRFKALMAIFVWLVLTLAMMFLFGVAAYIVGHASSQYPSVQPRPTLTYVSVHVIYFAVCYLLVDWVARPKRVPSDAT
jgi:peptidoglycan biosynthesis protein MviN/MurJ (putative lipid II flippase)